MAIVWWLAAMVAVGGAAQGLPRSEADQRYAIIAAEDARAPTQASLDVLLAGARSTNPAIQRIAVRALGRLERPDLAAAIAPLLTARAAVVRAEAANAMGQAIVNSADRAGPVGRQLIARMQNEKDASVRGALCETIGRLPYTAAGDLLDAETALYDATWRGAFRWAPGSSTSQIDPAPLPVLVGAVKGLESLYRINSRVLKASAMPLVRLRVLAVHLPEAAKRPATPDQLSLRRLAAAALVAAKDRDAVTLGFLSKVPDPQTRRLAIIALTSGDPVGADAKTTVRQALIDPSPLVRYEALRAYGRLWQGDGCAQIVNAVADTGQVAILALDLLGGGCPAAENVGAVLMAVADRIERAGAAGRTWQQPAHAIVSLARLDGAQAAKRLPAFSGHPVWQVRMYAARAAAALHDSATLRALAGDASDNVREAAVRGLSRVVGHEADAVYLAALERPDYQLILAAVLALGGTPDRDRAMPALLSALARLTAQDRDTSRDARRAILARVREFGSADAAGEVARYLGDFDPRVAQAAADALTKWTGQPHAPKTTVMRLSPPPTLEELRGIRGLTARVTVRGAGICDLKLLSDDAPAAVVRFARLARAGYYDGLTFHRVEPGFVVQGGSPGANEYMGDGPFMRDEVGLASNLAGSVGISTRGRDTGDAQFFINLIDNVRLDHVYTVFAQVVQGMDVVDALLEGDVIERVEIVAPARAGR